MCDVSRSLSLSHLLYEIPQRLSIYVFCTYIDLQDLRKEIGMRFLSDPNFQIFVNKEKIDLLDIPGINVHKFNAEIDGIEQPIEIIGIDTQRPDGTTKQHGVAWHVNGRLVGQCSWKGPNGEKFLDGRKSIAKRFTFIVRADCLSDLVKPDWEGFNNDDDIYPRALEAVNQAILKFISDFFSEARTETFNEIKGQNEPVLKKLSPTEIEEWEGFVKTTQEECVNLSDDVLNDLAKILANLLQAKSRYALIHKLGEYNPNQLDDLNDILSKWTVDMAKEVLDELEIRMLLVKELEAKVKRTDTDELKDLQPLFERGLWIFGPEYESLHFTSNKGMTKVLRDLLGVNETGSRNRPDFVILPDSSIGTYSVPRFSDDDGGEVGVDRLVIVELKKPGIPLGSEQREQTLKYIRELKQKGAIDNHTKVTGFLFVRKLSEGVNCYIHFSNGKDRNGHDSIPMDNLRKLCGGAFSLHFILLLAANKLPDHLFDYLVNSLETFLFYFIVTKSTTRDLERNFSLWADELRSISELPSEAEKKASLQAFIDKHLKSGAKDKLDEFEDDFKRFSFHSLQQYRIRYILAKLTQHVDMAYRGEKKPGRLDNYLKLEIEHILPDTPKADFKEDFESNHPDTSYDYMKNKLGNLTLLEKPINIVAGRKYFEDKIPHYQQSGNYLTRSIVETPQVGQNTSIDRINETLISFDGWCAESIENRQKMLTELAKQVWKIEDLAA